MPAKHPSGRSRALCSRYTLWGRATAAAMALSAIVTIRPATAEPGDIFTTSAPAITDQPPAATDIAVADASVSTQTGTLSYGFRIKTPPGRGMQPTLSLAYSSQSPIYGGIAAGWVLAGVPAITEDTSQGRISARQFTSSLSGGRPLVPVNEVGQGESRWRAANDTSWIRYEKHTDQPYYWRALAPDGAVYFFGHHGGGDNHTTGCTTISDGNSPLTRASDAFGNLIDYIWRPGIDGECRLAAITWGHSSNPSVGVGYFAAVEFQYSIAAPPCDWVGSQTSWRTGVKIVTGASRLDAIRIAAFPPQGTDPVTATPIPGSPEHTRTISLTYSSPNADCPSPTGHAAFRQLLSIQESAVGVDSPLVTLPAITFQYGNASLDWNTTPTETEAPWNGTHDNRDAYNLGWGYRFNSAQGAGWPTVEAMMVDLDGDGMLDRLSNEPYREPGGGVQFCRARWERNLGRDAFGQLVFASNALDPDPAKRPRYIDLPTLKWATPVGTPTYDGGLIARIDPVRGAFEQCALNYQRTGYVNSSSNVVCQPDGLGGCPSTNYCSYGTDCVAKTTPVGNTYFAWRWFDIDGDGRTDLIGSPIQGGVHSYNLQWGTGIAGFDPTVPQEPSIFGAWPACPTGPYEQYTADPTDTPNRPYTMCNGMFPWLVYLNHGDGVFGVARTQSLPPTHATWGSTPDRIIYQPIPLETTTGDSSLTSAPVGSTQGTIDLDGDGYTDAVYRPPYDGPILWGLYLNDRMGHFTAWSQGFPYWFSSGPNYKLTRVTEIPEPKTVEGLFDFQGDGLVDHWIANCSICVAQGAIHDGTQFRLPNGVPEISSLKPGVNSRSFDQVTAGSFIESGWRIDSTSEMDVDLDGRVDLAEFPDPSTGILAPKIYFNQGIGFAVGNNDSVRYDLAAVNRILGKKDWIGNYMGGSTSFTWETRMGLVDLDGDGIPESVSFPNEDRDPLYRLVSARITTPTQPPRLLVSIDNGRGATTSVTYSSMHGAAVQQTDPQRTMPRHEWVVQSITVTDSLASTTTTSSYLYKNPRYHADDRGQYGFRGFDEVTTTRQSGAKTVETFSYSPDWSGRLQKSIVVPAQSEQTVTDEVRSVDETSWEARTSFNGLLTTYHATLVDHWTCKNGQTEAACRANTDTRTRNVSTLIPLPNAGSPVLWTEESHRLQDTELEASATPTRTGTRRTTTTFAFVEDATTYRLRPLTTVEEELQSGNYVPYAKTASTWDPNYLVVTDEDVWFSDAALACTPAATHCARTHRVFDMSTGNVLERYKPNQWSAGGTAKESYAYDNRKLFVATETNEIGHVRDFTWEYGTGTKLRTMGPNLPPCALGPPYPPCPSGSPAKEEHRIRVDGLGRMIERFEVFADPGFESSYRTYVVETNAYVDGPTASVTHQTAIDNQAQIVRYRQTRTDLDGHGRPIAETVFALGSAPADQVTRFVYANDGTLVEVKVPDPTLNNATLISYTYTFDSLGRPLTVRRPDTTVLAERSGVDIAYDGLTTSSTEIVGPLAGQPTVRPAVTTTRNDAFGRLAQVDEQLSASPVTWSTTLYGYGPDDLVRTITDPEAFVTMLSHDFAGRRTAITRGARTWQYGYDKNNNQTSETPPCTGTNCQASYISSTVFDALDRPTSKLNAPRNLSSGDLALFGSSSETYTWDGGWNGVGRLTLWCSPSSG